MITWSRDSFNQSVQESWHRPNFYHYARVRISTFEVNDQSQHLMPTLQWLHLNFQQFLPCE